MILHVLNKSFELVGVIDTFVSVIWRPAYYDVGDFEVYLPATTENIQLLQRDWYIVRDSDIQVNGSDVIYKNVMLIKNFDIKTDVEKGNFLTVTGRELKFILHQRIVWEQTNLSGNVEEGIRDLISENVMNPKNMLRQIPNFYCDVKAGLTDTFTKQITGDYLDEAITEICTAFQYGWEVYIKNKKFYFRVYKGVNRSYNQSENPFVVFSDMYDNLYSTDYQLSSENYANVTLVAGEGEGTARTRTTAGDTSSTGLDRFEMYTDARDLSRNEGSENELTVQKYYSILEERGIEKLAECKHTEGFSGEIVNNVSFVYGTDYYIGDTVTVCSSYGITKDVIVLSSIESIDNSGSKLIPQFNM